MDRNRIRVVVAKNAFWAEVRSIIIISDKAKAGLPMVAGHSGVMFYRALEPIS